MLIVMAGLPGSGKSTVAEGIAKALRCALLAVDPIEAALWRAGIERSQPTGLAAYLVAEDLAREQLLVGNDAVVDAVNDVEEARTQWKSLAAAAATPLVFIEAFCSDASTHRRRLESRGTRFAGFPEPTWESVVARRANIERWPDSRLRLDTLRPLHESIADALALIDRVRAES